MNAWAMSLKLFAYLVVILVAAAIAYSAVTAVRYWPAISV